jgi:sugar fermentation stimulation protein A
VKGTYCLVLELPEDARVRVGALGVCEFPAGVYVYVGSAMSGIEQRVARHVRRTKKRRWHIDYLLDRTTVLSIVAIPSQTKDTECAIARAFMSSEGSRVIVRGFGSSDCRCESHLFHFGAEDPAWASEIVAKTVAMLSCVYPSYVGSERE